MIVQIFLIIWGKRWGGGDKNICSWIVKEKNVNTSNMSKLDDKNSLCIYSKYIKCHEDDHFHFAKKCIKIGWNIRRFKFWEFSISWPALLKFIPETALKKIEEICWHAIGCSWNNQFKENTGNAKHGVSPRLKLDPVTLTFDLENQ